MKQFFLKLFTWWNGQTFGTQLWTWRFGELVGMSPGAYRRQQAQVRAGLPSCLEKAVARPVRNREAATDDAT